MLAMLVALASTVGPNTPEPLPGVKRVLILGDSITAVGKYTAYLESYFATRHPEREIEFINLGLPSETISGRSEPSHPWPRPNVHERLERALRIKPDLVMACYGMNDGIYHPFSEDRFAGFKEGVNLLIVECKRRGVPLYLITPPPFDPVPVRAKLKPAGADDYGWMTPYERYQEEVLVRYADWEKDRAKGGDVKVIDAQTQLAAFLNDQRTKFENPDYKLADDGVHVNADGNWIIGRAILDAIGAKLIDPEAAVVDAKTLRAAHGDVSNIRSEADGVRFSWTTNLPMPRDPDWSDVISADRTWEARLGHHLISVEGLPDGPYGLYEGTRSVGKIEVQRGSALVDLRKFPEISSNRKADHLGDLIRERERIMSPAWRDHVGHKRPDTEKGLPLDEAKKKAEPLTAEIHRLNRPITLELSVRAN